MILIAYDGTTGSDHAIAVAASLLPQQRAHVVHVWEPLSNAAAGMAFLGTTMPAGAPVDEVITRQEDHAKGVAAAGAELARAGGFEADSEAILSEASAAQTLEDAVDRLQPDLVVIGSRGLTGFKALLKGSVSHHVGAHAHAPVLIIPPEPPGGD